MPTRARRWIPLLVLAVVAGCDYFRPADPPSPASGDVIPADYTSVEGTLETVRLAVEAKGLQGAAEAYAGAFADSAPPPSPPSPGFLHFWWPADEAAWVAGGREVPDWNHDEERVFYNIGARSLVNLRDEDYQMTWEAESGNPDEPGDGFVIAHRRYRIDAMGVAGVPVEIIARGYADLTITQLSDGNWKITRWNDRADPEPDPLLPQRTWGQRRLESKG